MVQADGPEGRQFLKLVAEAYNKARLSKDEAERVNNAPGLGDVVAKFIGDWRFDGPPFYLRLTLSFVVDVDYEHATALSKLPNSLFLCSKEVIGDEHYREPSHRLIPGHAYEVDVFDIKPRRVMGFEECLELASGKNGLLTGIQGIAIIWQKCRRDFPRMLFWTSFDKKERLYQHPVQGHLVPSLSRHFDAGELGRDSIDLEDVGCGWDHSSSILRFRDVTAIPVPTA